MAGGVRRTVLTVRRLGGMVRLRLWSRGLARCNHCARMTRQEWEAMCDCWLADVAWWRRFVR